MVQFSQQRFVNTVMAAQAAQRLPKRDDFGDQRAVQAFQAGDDQAVANVDVGIGQTVGGHNILDAGVEERGDVPERIARLDDVHRASR